MMRGPIATVEEIAAAIPDGALVALPREIDGAAMAAIGALVRRGARDLRVLCVPQGGLQVDILIGAGCVAALETSAVSLGEHGPAACFQRAVAAASLALRDSTCPAIHAGLRAGEAGIPFMALGGILGSDLVRHRPDWRIIDNPLAKSGDPILVVPALRPDVALFHAPKADHEGNVWIGAHRTLMTMAHAAGTTFVTVEEVVDDNFLEDEALAAGTIPALYIEGVVSVPGGARPLGLAGYYARDDAHLAIYAAAARTQAGFADYLAEHIVAARAAE